jgi:hypothetical protein
MNREDAKVVIAPVVHEASGRVTRTTARAYLVPRERDLQVGDTGCEHTHGHKTVDAARRCGVAMWNNLPSKGA